MNENAERFADIFGVFSNSKRVLIFWTLNGQEMSVNEIASSIDSSLQNTSQHLRLMKSKQILVSRRDGQMIYYRIADSEAAIMSKNLHQDMLDSLRPTSIN